MTQLNQFDFKLRLPVFHDSSMGHASVLKATPPAERQLANSGWLFKKKILLRLGQELI